MNLHCHSEHPVSLCLMLSFIWLTYCISTYSIGKIVAHLNLERMIDFKSSLLDTMYTHPIARGMCRLLIISQCVDHMTKQVLPLGHNILITKPEECA